MNKTEVNKSFMQKTRSFLKWAGGKYQCLNTLLAHLPRGNRLIEPFMGSGVVFANTDYPSYLLAEQNADLISLFTCLRDHHLTFIDYCASYFSTENNSRDKFYEFREEFNYSAPSFHRAALFLYLNRHGYNGLCRYNSEGIYNVPFGSHRKPYFPRREMQYFMTKNQHAQFLVSDFRETFKLAVAGDVIYCDPPYVPLSKSASFTKYTAGHFTESDQIELAQLAKAAAQKGVSVLISNHDTPFTREHYTDCEVISFPVRRSISCGVRQPVQELLAIWL